MFTINIDKECGCFKKSDFENNMSFETNDYALMQANLMIKHMNSEFCGKHGFTLTENGNTFQITTSEPEKSGGCCGGGHCS
ncbi:MAG: hypothetical protein U9R37_04535 [Campylobacterota bacterium]|nr:hypothetical protein [Campylobacterota bacterium]